MAPSTFTSFLRLPPEIRQQIWKYAVRPFHRNGWLQHILLTTCSCSCECEGGCLCLCSCIPVDSVLTLPHTDETKSLASESINYTFVADGCGQRLYLPDMGQDNTANGNANRSGYCWDAGLWTACWESNAVMRTRLLGQGPSLKNLEDTQLTPQSLVVRQSGDPWVGVIHHARDIFCLRLENWSADINWSLLRLVLKSISRNGRMRGSLLHVALEFDSSWNRDWPRWTNELFVENSPRGCAARIISDMYHGDVSIRFFLIERAGPSGCTGYDLSDAYLNRRYSRPSSRSLYRGSDRYQDCDTDYVKVCSYPSIWSGLPIPGSAAMFVDRLLELWSPGLSWWHGEILFRHPGWKYDEEEITILHPMNMLPAKLCEENGD